MSMPSIHRKQLSAMTKQLQALNGLLKNKKFLAVIEEFHTSPKARKAASKDANRYFTGKGVRPPDGMTIALHDHNWRISVCVVALGCAHYDSHDGWGWGP